MKISILTFSKEINYGANLQCYALCNTLKKLGHTIEIIDIQLPTVYYSFISNLMSKVDRFLFDDFRKKHLNYFSEYYKTVEQLKNNFPKSDLYIVGSDQVWNPEITKRLNVELYYFSFLPDNAKRIAYAASFGVEEWNNKTLTPKLSSLLKKFSSIGVREEKGVDICKNIFKVNATEVLDPTLLLDSYDAICGKYNKEKQTKRLIYFKFIKSKIIENGCIKIAQQYKLQPIYLGGRKIKKNFKYKPYATISNWLNEIRYANFIVTDSFHCMVFCILFQRQFIVLPSVNGRASRITNLLKQLEINERFCSSEEDFQLRSNTLYKNKINYKYVNIKLEKLRSESFSFLINSIDSTSQ